jgi:hypothetical protein
MKKWDELSDPDSCLNRAHDDEILFVLLARDKASPATVRFWIEERIRLGLNGPDDPQIQEASIRAHEMEQTRDEIRARN